MPVESLEDRRRSGFNDHRSGGRGAVEGDGGLPVELEGEALRLGVADGHCSGFVVPRERVGHRRVLASDPLHNAVLRKDFHERGRAPPARGRA